MGKNIVICSDGTGNTFDSRITNVTRLVRHLLLTRPDQQVIRYDQGVGTSERREEDVAALLARLDDKGALRILSTPITNVPLINWLGRARGLLFGYGLKENVRQLYRELAQIYDGPTDSVFLFGFSRGAFTVRALAGLLHRCHLPKPATADEIDERFERAWRLFQPMVADVDAVRELRGENRPCPVHFLGVWDTVKSYGGLNPVILPHLRHNPDVAHVCHAIALDERRAWFKPTTWGQLDSDRETAMTRVDPRDKLAYRAQTISEAWFAGCHSDVGTGDIALRWMLGEATRVEPGLLISDSGMSFLREPDRIGPPEIHKSWTLPWRITEQVRRLEIDNSGVYPIKVSHRGSDGVRLPENSRRHDGTVTVHASVGNHHTISGKVNVCETWRP